MVCKVTEETNKNKKKNSHDNDNDDNDNNDQQLLQLGRPKKTTSKGNLENDDH